MDQNIIDFYKQPHLERWVNNIGGDPTNAIKSANDFVMYVGNRFNVNTGRTAGFIIAKAYEYLPEYIRSDVTRLDNIDLRPAIAAASKDATESKDKPFESYAFFQQEDVARLNQEIEAGYVQMAVDSMRSFNPNMTGQERDQAARTELAKLKDGFSPLAAATAKTQQTTLPSVESGAGATSDTSATSSVAPTDPEAGFDVTAGTGAYATKTYQQMLQENYNLTINDLVQLETSSGLSSQAGTYNAAGFVQRLTGKVASADDKEWSLGEAVQYLYKFQDDKSRVTQVQNMLRDGGYFKTLQTLPESGVIDDATRKAWDLFLTDAMRSGRTPSAQAEFATSAFNRKLTSGEGYMQLDPTTVESAARQLGEAIIGRGLSGSELASLLQNVRNWEQQDFVRGLTDPKQQRTDLEARIEDHIRTQYQDEAVMSGIFNSTGVAKKVYGD